MKNNNETKESSALLSGRLWPVTINSTLSLISRTVPRHLRQGAVGVGNVDVRAKRAVWESLFSLLAAVYHNRCVGKSCFQIVVLLLDKYSIMHGVVWHRITYRTVPSGYKWNFNRTTRKRTEHFLRHSKKNFHDYINQRKQISLIELIIIILGAVKVYTIKILRTVDHNNPKYT